MFRPKLTFLRDDSLSHSTLISSVSHAARSLLRLGSFLQSNCIFGGVASEVTLDWCRRRHRRRR